MRRSVVINNREISVEFSGEYDSAYGEFLFTQVMCDVFMPGNEVVPIAAEKEQIKRVIDGFRKRKALYDEVRKEIVKGKACYVITPRMRYDLAWLSGKKKVVLSKDKPPVVVYEDSSSNRSAEETAPSRTTEPSRALDARRKHLVHEGFQYQAAAKTWTYGTIRFPDAMVDKAKTDEEFTQGMARLLEADAKERSRRDRKREQ